MNAFEKTAETQGFAPKWPRFLPEILPIAVYFAKNPVYSTREDDGGLHPFGI